MKDVEFFSVDRVPIDDELQDVGTVGPELAYLAHSYGSSPRALIFRNPSSDWRLFVVLLPLASRLSLMANPIFAQLTRAWGLNIRFIGIDREQLAYDFRALLSDQTLKLLVDLLARSESADGADPAHGRAALDLLFASLADEMLTVLDRRRADWGRHLDREHHLEAEVPASLFDRAGRYPDFLAGLRRALRDEIIDVEFYGRALRSIDLRESTIDARVRAVIEASLDPVTMTKLARTGAGQHLGCYNWLRIDPRHAAPRAHLLTRLPAFAAFFAETLVPLDAWRPEAIAAGVDTPGVDAPGIDASGDGTAHGGDAYRDDEHDPDEHSERRARARRQIPTFDLKPLAARQDSAHSLRWAAVLKRAIDAGQDRAVIEAIAQRFAVGDNVIRRVWREQPAALGQPPTWHLAQILRRLGECTDRTWPADAAAWQALIASSIPVEAG
ncbi:MAG: hypothetical protein J0H09_25665 [Burkholderiales bacterium]|nr:hypothetical protein [Burkholderiales bacterium]